MQNPDRVQEQVREMGSGASERLDAANAYRKMTEERRGATERELTKFRALTEVFGLCEPSLVQHRAQIAGGQNPSIYVIEGLDAAIEELRRLQKQTQEFVHKNEGALNALTALEDVFRQAAAQNSARVREVTAVAPKATALAESRTDAGEDESLGLLDALGEEEGQEESAKEPIAEPRRGASRKPK